MQKKKQQKKTTALRPRTVAVQDVRGEKIPTGPWGERDWVNDVWRKSLSINFIFYFYPSVLSLEMEF